MREIVKLACIMTHRFYSAFYLLCCISGVLTVSSAQAQPTDFEKRQSAFRALKDSVFFNPETSPLTEEDLASFSGLPYFEPDTIFVVKARFEPSESDEIVEMPTTTERIARYRVEGTLHFELLGEACSLKVFRNMSLAPAFQKRPDIPLFLPFTDLSNGESTYGGGRYMDVQASDDTIWTLDFNQSYHPYCAYNPRYSCPIPPRENHLPVEVHAGIKLMGTTK